MISSQEMNYEFVFSVHYFYFIYCLNENAKKNTNFNISYSNNYNE